MAGQWVVEKNELMKRCRSEGQRSALWWPTGGMFQRLSGRVIVIDCRFLIVDFGFLIGFVVGWVEAVRG
jgi:hypothetical protein